MCDNNDNTTLLQKGGSIEKAKTSQPSICWLVKIPTKNTKDTTVGKRLYIVKR